jgi:galactose mutarotase-like enzyme
MIILENEYLKASISTRGAELQSMYHKGFGLEYIWNGKPEFWPKHSPVLFPVVGALKEDIFLYKGNKYRLPRHGFARDNEFEVEFLTPASASFLLRSTNETRKSYPFDFLLRLVYTLNGASLAVTYEIGNTSTEPMYFSIGAHPAFNVPLTQGSEYEDYYLEFEQQENSNRYTLNGNLVRAAVPYLDQQTILPLIPSLFYEDALIFKDLKSDRISLRNHKNAHGIHFYFSGFPYMGIWAAKDAPFVCIEPWCGIADSENHNQKIEEKEGIICLAPAHCWDREWCVECF